MGNPSDLITPKQIIDLNGNKLWWEGPIFLKEHDIFENKNVIKIDIIEEKHENTFVCLSDIKDQVDLSEVLNINKYSNFKKLVRTTFWVLRFVDHIKKKIKIKFVKDVFCEKNDDKMYKAWVTLYMCASTRAFLLDLVPQPNPTSFINSFRRMIARRGCPNNIISDNGKPLFLMKPSRFLPT